MADHGPLFSAPMVRALLAGTKTQTRRNLYALRNVKDGRVLNAMFDHRYPPPMTGPNEYPDLRRSYAVGDRLWVREAWRVGKRHDDKAPRDITPRSCSIMFEAGGAMQNREAHGWSHEPDWPVAGKVEPWAGRLRASMHMPRWASRLTLTVTDVRVQRLQDISEEDAIAEGGREQPFARLPGMVDGIAINHGQDLMGQPGFETAKQSYRNLWNRINGDGSWDANPWVVAYSFRCEQRNIDAP